MRRFPIILVPRVCSFCRVVYGWKEGRGMTGATHGVCLNCLSLYYPRTAERYLRTEAVVR